MLTRLQVRNFKRLHDVEVELGRNVVFIGPNNSGKTTALQAIALWDIGLRRWNERRSGEKSPAKRPGVAINRKDLAAIPVPTAKLLWRNLRTHETVRGNGNGNIKATTRPRSVEVILDGVLEGRSWTCGFEFDYANEESFHCRPFRPSRGAGTPAGSMVPPEAGRVRSAFLPPMSGLADREFSKQPGEVAFLIGQGQTAQVLRNLCFQLFRDEERQDSWAAIVRSMESLFGVQLSDPVFISERGEISMAYSEHGIELDLSSSGRGFQQTLLLLTYMRANPGAVLLLDEPDAHLEILRQKQIYAVLTETAEESGSQIIAASHSEVVLAEAADRDVVVAFVGKPHRIDDRGSQAAKALKEIGFDQYMLAEQTGWVLYLEGATDLAILHAFAKTLKHPAAALLERPFVHYVANQISKARDHFYGLREACKGLAGLVILDRQEASLQDGGVLTVNLWRRREIENYLCHEEVLMAYAADTQADNLFGLADLEKRQGAMRRSIAKVSDAVKTLHRTTPWSHDLKVSDVFLTRLFEEYFDLLGLPNLMRKSDFHVLTKFVPVSLIDPEVVEKLDSIVETARRATPVRMDDHA